MLIVFTELDLRAFLVSTLGNLLTDQAFCLVKEIQEQGTMKDQLLLVIHKGEVTKEDFSERDDERSSDPLAAALQLKLFRSDDGEKERDFVY